MFCLLAQTEFIPNERNPELWVNMLLDEMPNLGMIPNLNQGIIFARKYKVSISCIFQSIKQFRMQYEDQWMQICGNCDFFLYLGGSDFDTQIFVSPKCHVPLLEVVKDLPKDKCILNIRGNFTHIVEKYSSGK